MNQNIDNNYKKNLNKRYVFLLTKTFTKEFLEKNKIELYKIIKCINESKLLSEIMLTFDDSKLLKIFKYFTEKRKCIYEILTNFNNDHKLSFNFKIMNLYIEYIIFFANITSNEDVYNFYGNLLIKIRKYPLLYPEFSFILN